MRITSYGHATIAIDTDVRLTIDPGTFGNARGALARAVVVLITHEHVDHVDAPAVVDHLMGTPSSQVWAPGGVAADLIDQVPSGVARRIHVAAPGETFTAAGFTVRAGGGTHALIHRSIPQVPNVSYLVEADGIAVYHPGDSFDTPEAEVDVLFIPVSGPWMKLGEAMDFAAAVPTRYAVPVHDALLSDVGHALTHPRLEHGNYTYVRLASGEAFEVTQD